MTWTKLKKKNKTNKKAKKLCENFKCFLFYILLKSRKNIWDFWRIHRMMRECIFQVHFNLLKIQVLAMLIVYPFSTQLYQVP